METTMKVQDIPLSDILADEEFNCRGPILPMDVVDLAKNIQENGLLQPVAVMPMPEDRNIPQQYLLIAGYRRYTAFRVNASVTIPAVVHNEIQDEAQARLFNLTENLQRKQLNMTQEARALAKLEALGISEVEAAERLNMSRGWVQVRYMILRLPEVVQEEIAAGWLNQTQIRDVYSHFKNRGETACFEVVKQFKDDKLKGRKGTRKKVIKKKDRNKKKRRDVQEIFELQKHVFEQLQGNNIVTRVLAWCAGEITENDVHISLKDYAASIGKTYRVP